MGNKHLHHLRANAHEQVYMQERLTPKYSKGSRAARAGFRSGRCSSGTCERGAARRGIMGEMATQAEDGDYIFPRCTPSTPALCDGSEAGVPSCGGAHSSSRSVSSPSCGGTLPVRSLLSKRLRDGVGAGHGGGGDASGGRAASPYQPLPLHATARRCVGVPSCGGAHRYFRLVSSPSCGGTLPVRSL